MKINRQRLKEIIKSVMSEEKGYEEFFRSELKKAGFSSPAEMSDAEKREFFDKIDADWDAKNEELTGNQHKLDVDGDGEIEADDLAALRAGKKPVKEQESFDFGNDEVNGIFAKFKKLETDKTRKNNGIIRSKFTKTRKKDGIAYSYSYGTGGITFIVKDNNVKFAMFETDRVHDFLGHMQDLGFGSNLFARLTKLARKEELKGYTTVLHFGQPKNEGKVYPVKEEKSKYYVEIDTPREVDSNRVKGEIKSFMKRGAKSVDIGLRMNFLTTNPKDMMAKFQKVKNHVYFANDPMRFESVKRMNETKFIAFFNGKKHEVEGKDLWDAKQKAITMLKVPKSKVGLLAVVNAGEHERGSFQFEGLAPDVAKLIGKIHKGFVKVEGDGTMIYDSPANAKKAADILNKNKIAASTDGKYLHIESKTRR
jgi:hypothetical protein